MSTPHLLSAQREHCRGGDGWGNASHSVLRRDIRDRPPPRELRRARSRSKSKGGPRSDSPLSVFRDRYSYWTPSTPILLYFNVICAARRAGNSSKNYAARFCWIFQCKWPRNINGKPIGPVVPGIKISSKKKGKDITVLLNPPSSLPSITTPARKRKIAELNLLLLLHLVFLLLILIVLLPLFLVLLRALFLLALLLLLRSSPASAPAFRPQPLRTEP